MFVTNNSTKSRKGYLGKFTSLGLNVNAEEIYSSSYAAAAYLESINFPQDKKVDPLSLRPPCMELTLMLSPAASLGIHPVVHTTIVGLSDCGVILVVTTSALWKSLLTEYHAAAGVHRWGGGHPGGAGPEGHPPLRGPL